MPQDDKHIKAKENLFDDLIELEEKAVEKIKKKLSLFDNDKDKEYDWTYRKLIKIYDHKLETLQDLRSCQSDLKWIATAESEK